MSTYTHSDFELIATAIGAALESVANLESKFEAAAFWFRVDKRQPTRTPPSKRREKLTQVAKSARRLLKSLGINDPDEAPDGPGDPDIFKALVLTGEPDENPVVEATRRIGRLVELVEGIAAAAEFDRRAQKAATEVGQVGKLTVRSGNTGDDAVNDWIAAMLGIYRTLTGKEPATSVGAPARPNAGKAAGPLIRFLQAAGNPLNIEFSEDAWRSRVRTILKSASEQIWERFGHFDLDLVAHHVRVVMRQRDSTSVNNSQPAPADVLIALVRLLARQAAAEFASAAPVPADTRKRKP